MGLFSKSKPEPVQPIQQEVKEERSFISGALNFNSSSSYTSSTSLRLSAVYCAVNVISNTIASLPLNVFQIDVNGFKNINYQHPINHLLDVQPSRNLTRFNFFKLLVSSVMLKGNAYALLTRDQRGIVTEIKYIQTERVNTSYNQLTDTITYYVTGYKQPIASENMLHFWLYSNDLVNGLSIINYSVNTLKLATDSENHSQNFFKSGAATNGILKVSGKLNDTQKQDVKASWNSAFNDSTSVGVAIIPENMDYQPISVNAKDAQLLESRQFNVVEIARFFNISPVKLYDLTHSSYSSLEQTQLSFLQDTINPYLIMIEQELNRKLFTTVEKDITKVQFNRSELLSTDKTATATYYKEMLASGIMTINEVRKALNLNDVENGDNLFMQLNMSTVKNLINQNPKDQEKLKQKVKDITK